MGTQGSRGRWIRAGVGVSALAAILALSAPARADDGDPEEDPRWKPPDVDRVDLDGEGASTDRSDARWGPVERDVHGWLARGDAKAALAATAGRASLVALALRPKTALLLHRESLANVRALRANDLILSGLLVARNRVTAILIDRSGNPAPEAQAAAAFGHLSYLAFHTIAGVKPDLDELKGAASALARNEATAQVTLAEWKEVLLPALALAQNLNEEAIASWAKGEIARLAAAHPADPDIRRLLLLVDLEDGVALARTRPAEAAPLLTRALVALAAKDAIPPRDTVFLSHYNAGVTAARTAGISVAADYKTKAVAGPSLSVEIPLAIGWEVPRGDEEETEPELCVTRAGGTGRGGVSLVVVPVRASAAPGQGDPLSQTLGDDLRARKAALQEVRRESPNAARPWKTLTVKKSWDLFGTSPDGKLVRAREWGIVTSGAKPFVVRLIETSASDKDPEVARVIGSLAEKVASKEDTK